MTESVLPLSQQVAKHANISLEKALELIQMGAVYLEKIRITEDKEIKAGAYLRLHTRPRRYSVDAIDWAGILVFQNADFVIVNKPAGIPVPSTVDNIFENVTYQVSKALGAPLYVTQRLDRPTSGLLLLAKTKEFQREFNQLLFKRAVHKRYVALTEKHVLPKSYTHFIEDSKTVPKKISEKEQPGFVTAELEVVSSTQLRDSTCFESEIKLITGRTHQIRAQFSYLGFPLLGDVPYGGSEKCGFYENKIALRAIELGFLNHQFTTKRFSDEIGAW